MAEPYDDPQINLALVNEIASILSWNEPEGTPCHETLTKIRGTLERLRELCDPPKQERIERPPETAETNPPSKVIPFIGRIISGL